MAASIEVLINVICYAALVAVATGRLPDHGSVHCPRTVPLRR